MASEKKEDVDVEDGEETQTEAKEKKYDTGSASLEKVTDFAEEKELKAENLSSVRFAEERGERRVGKMRQKGENWP